MIGDCSPNVLLNLIGIQTKIADNSLLFDLHDYIYRKRYLETLGFLSLTLTYAIALKSTKRKQKGKVSLLEHASMQLVNRQDYRLCKNYHREGQP